MGPALEVALLVGEDADEVYLARRMMSSEEGGLDYSADFFLTRAQGRASLQLDYGSVAVPCVEAFLGYVLVEEHPKLHVAHQHPHLRLLRKFHAQNELMTALEQIEGGQKHLGDPYSIHVDCDGR